MDEKRRMMMDSQSTWREDAHKTAVLEADRSGLRGPERDEFIKAREAERYAELEKLAMEH
jgi:hypothetical protein